MGKDETEAMRRELIPLVNEPAVQARAAATETVREAARAAGIGDDDLLTEEQQRALLDQRDAEAKRLLWARLAAEHGNVYDTELLSEHFDVVGFSAPFVVVRRKEDGQLGSMSFTHHPRLYFGFQPYNG